MASTETTTVRVRRSTHERLQREAALEGTSVTQVLERAADLLEEQRVLDATEETLTRLGNLSPEARAREIARDDEWVREIESGPPPTDRD